MIFGRKLIVLTMLTLGVLLLVGAIAIQAQEQENVIRVGMDTPINLDPATGSADDEVFVNRHIYDYLVEVLPNGEIVPSLATDWQISDDGLTYTFNLVEDATFHDGSALTADDVVFSFSRLIEVGSSTVGILGQRPEGEETVPTWTVEAVDDTTVQFNLEQPNADFLFGVGFRFSMILPEGLDTPNVIGQDGGLENFNGSGAFRLESFSPSEGATLVRNEAYWGAAPALDGVELVFLDDDNTQINAIVGGEVDFIYGISFDALPTLEAADNITLQTVATNLHPVIRLRSDEGHLGEDVRVRQAFKAAIDRELLNLDLLDGLGAVGNNDPIGPVYGPLFNEANSISYDPAQACALIAEYAADRPDVEWLNTSGDEPRIEVDFFVVDSFNYPRLAEFMQQQWADGCIDVNIQVQQTNVYYADTQWLEVDLGLTGWGSRPVAQAYLTEAYVTGAPFNEAHWSTPELDALVGDASVTADPEARAAIYDEIRAIFAEEGPVIIPFFAPQFGAVANDVEGLSLHSFPGRTDLDNVSISG